jgi:protein-S-isoprenylcysteine O-methyltransferase Ste14
MSETKSGFKIIPPLIFFGLILAATGLHFVWGGWPTLRLQWVGWPLIVLGLGPAVWVSRMFRSEGTTIKPHDTPSALLTGGPFRFSRNPIYLGAAVSLLGLALVVGSLPFYLNPPLMAAALHYGFIPMEERNLEAALGQPYLDYKASVRRWI